MATTNTIAELAIKPQTRDYAVIEVHSTETDEKGQENKVIKYTAISGKDAIQKAKDEGRFKFEQTVTWNEATNDEGQKLVIKAEKDRARAFNAGVMSSLINPRVKRLLEEVDENDKSVLVFEPQQGAYDLTNLINEPAQRRSLSDMEKAVAAMMPLFPDKTEAEIYVMLQGLKAAGVALPGQTDSDDSDEAEAEGSEAETAAV